MRSHIQCRPRFVWAPSLPQLLYQINNGDELANEGGLPGEEEEAGSFCANLASTILGKINQIY